MMREQLDHRLLSTGNITISFTGDPRARYQDGRRYLEALKQFIKLLLQQVSIAQLLEAGAQRIPPAMFACSGHPRFQPPSVMGFSFQQGQGMIKINKIVKPKDQVCISITLQDQRYTWMDWISFK
jgi:hypothetical protein